MAFKIIILARKLYLLNVLFFPKFLKFITRILYSCDIPYESQISDSVIFRHNALGVVIHPKAIIGKGTMIMQHVTLGGNLKKSKYFENRVITAPIIGNNVFIGSSAQILGPVIIGDNAKIGAGSIVVKDVPRNGVVVGVPAKLIKIQKEEEVVKVKTL